ncbi:MAG: hypothetical protein OXG11_13115 [Chloroflexi bacterium]|nr:hypothetical protein [Chloroflexota bacterium]
MSTYKEALFEAFVWSQVVEEAVGDLVRQEAGISRKAVRRKSFHGLIERLEPHVEPCVYEALHALRKDRNTVVHRSSYIMSILGAAAAPEDFEDEKHEDTLRLGRIKRDAGDLFGYLIERLTADDEPRDEA